MNVQKQIEEYRKKQEERFKSSSLSESDEEDQYNHQQYQQEADRLEMEERKRIEEQDLEIAQRVERELNFRIGSGFQDMEGQVTSSNLDDDIGEEGHPAQIPYAINEPYPHRSSQFDGNQERDTYVRQDPPKWLVHPIQINQEKIVKVYDFKRGTVNDELRNTTDSSVNFEYENIEDPTLKQYSASDLENCLAHKQKK
jgi:hypothetical protein